MVTISSAHGSLRRFRRPGHRHEKSDDSDGNAGEHQEFGSVGTVLLDHIRATFGAISADVHDVAHPEPERGDPVGDHPHTDQEQDVTDYR